MLEEIIKVITAAAEQNRAKIAACAAYGARCERWFQVELFCAFVAHFKSRKGAEVALEQDTIDLVVSDLEQRYLIELKTVPCNYGRSGKNITQSIASVRDDLHKLQTLCKANVTGLAAWLAYPVPEQTPPSWPMHLSRVEQVASRTLLSARIPLWAEYRAHLYIMQAQAAAAASAGLH